MKVYFADTSAFAKRYVPEIGTNWVRNWIDPQSGNRTVISALGTVEFMALLARRRREGTISSADFNRLQNDFLFHLARDYRPIPLTINVIVEARQLVIRHPIRTLDALQLASAQVATKTIGGSVIFVSADQKLLTIALAEGFLIDNPNNHP